MMNERIEKLSHLAWTKTSEAVPFYDSTGNISRDFNFKYVQMFAELIVRECIKVVDDTMTENQEMNIGLVMASAAIIAHFGVEE